MIFIPAFGFGNQVTILLLPIVVLLTLVGIALYIVEERNKKKSEKIFEEIEKETIEKKIIKVPRAGSIKG